MKGVFLFILGAFTGMIIMFFLIIFTAKLMDKKDKEKAIEKGRHGKEKKS